MVQGVVAQADRSPQLSPEGSRRIDRIAQLSLAVERLAITGVAVRSERANRVIDHDQDGSMELKKREGYF